MSWESTGTNKHGWGYPTGTNKSGTVSTRFIKPSWGYPTGTNKSGTVSTGLIRHTFGKTSFPGKNWNKDTIASKRKLISELKIQNHSIIIEENESCKVCTEILSMSKDQIKEIYNKIIKLNRGQYFVDFLQFAIKIRPNNAENFLKLLALFATKNSYKYNTDGYMRYLLAYFGIIPFEISDTKGSLNKILYEFKENSIEEAILNDDEKAFTKLIAEPCFNPNKKISLEKGTPIDFVQEIKDNEIVSVNGRMGRVKLSTNVVTYMQLIAYFGSVKCLKVALSNGNFLTEDICSFAVAGGNREIISILRQKDFSFDYCFEVSSAFHRHEISDWLLNNYKCETFSIDKALRYYNDTVFLFLSKNGYGDISLSEACQYNSIVAVKYLIKEKGVNAEECDGNSTPLHIARMKGYTDIVSYLMEELHNFPPVEEKPSCFIADINDAATKGDIKSVQWLIEKENVDVETKGFRERTPLNSAAREGHLQIVMYLVEKFNVNIEARTNDGYTPLLNACQFGHLEVVEYLIEKCNANVNIKSNNSLTPLDLCCKFGGYENAKTLDTLLRKYMKE